MPPPGTTPTYLGDMPEDFSADTLLTAVTAAMSIAFLLASTYWLQLKRVGDRLDGETCDISWTQVLGPLIVIETILALGVCFELVIRIRNAPVHAWFDGPQVHFLAILLAQVGILSTLDGGGGSVLVALAPLIVVDVLETLRNTLLAILLPVALTRRARLLGGDQRTEPTILDPPAPEGGFAETQGGHPAFLNSRSMSFDLAYAASTAHLRSHVNQVALSAGLLIGTHALSWAAELALVIFVGMGADGMLPDVPAQAVLLPLLLVLFVAGFRGGLSRTRDIKIALQMSLFTVLSWIPTLLTVLLVSVAVQQRRSAHVALTPCGNVSRGGGGSGGGSGSQDDYLQYGTALLPAMAVAFFGMVVTAFVVIRIVCMTDQDKRELMNRMMRTIETPRDGPSGQPSARGAAGAPGTERPSSSRRSGRARAAREGPGEML